MDRLDRQIVDLLRENGRRSNVDVARNLGVSEGTIRKRVDRLVSTGALRIVGVADPGAVGLTVRTLILLDVELAQMAQVGHQLSAMPEVMSVYCVTGEHDLVVEAAFESDEALMRFLTERVAGIPGVLGSKTCHIPRVVKYAYEWTLPEPPPPTILVVDDDPDFVEVTRLMLEAEGFRTLAANSGPSALGLMAHRTPDLVILDIMMDGILDGWDASRRIRSDARFSDIPILVVSSITASEYLGMFPTDEDNLIDNFISKPVDPQRLLGEVRRLLKSR
jgi:Lrp/AsnC family transcriptional regulator, regulator for asnA, asnC and gidA